MLLNKLIVSLIIPISVVLISGCVDSTNKIQAIEATSLSGTALDLKDSTTYDNTPPCPQ